MKNIKKIQLNTSTHDRFYKMTSPIKKNLILKGLSKSTTFECDEELFVCPHYYYGDVNMSPC